MNKFPSWLKTNNKELERRKKIIKYSNYAQNGFFTSIILSIFFYIILFSSKKFVILIDFMIISSAAIAIFLLASLILSSLLTWGKDRKYKSTALIYEVLHSKDAKFKKWVRAKDHYREVNYISPLWKNIGYLKRIERMIDDFTKLLDKEVEIAFIFNKNKSSRKIIKEFENGLKIRLEKPTLKTSANISKITWSIKQTFEKDKFLTFIGKKYYKRSSWRIPTISDILTIIFRLFIK